MIVVGTNIIVHLVVSGEESAAAQAALRKDPDWAAPFLWRIEFCNVQLLYLRRRLLTSNDALNNLEHAQQLLKGREYLPSPKAVLNLAAAGNCTAYDCEFVALAQDLGVKLVTLDRQIPAHFPETAVGLVRFIGERS